MKAILRRFEEIDWDKFPDNKVSIPINEIQSISLSAVFVVLLYNY